MKFTNVDVQGIERVVFTNEGTVWFRDCEGGIYFWRKIDSNARPVCDQDMIRRIEYHTQCGSRVWISGNTVNIVTMPINAAPKFRYTGSMTFVTRCDTRIGKVCKDGSCPGHIDGKCPFTLYDEPFDGFKTMFERRTGS